MISHSQGSFQRDSAGSYRPTQASGFHGWERPNIAGGLSCTAWRSPCFWLLHIGGFRLYTLRRAQPLSMCRHTGAGHSCHRFRLHDRRLASYSSQRLDAPAVWCSVFPPSFAARRVRPLMPRIVGWCSTGGILHTEGVAADAPTPPHPCISIHAPREGCDLPFLFYHRPTLLYFNPRTPRGVRQRRIGDSTESSVFQSTHPARGATLSSPA